MFEISISPLMMAKKKTCKEDQMKKILSTICALLNSGGGNIRLCFQQNPSRRYIQDSVRMIEQRAVEILAVKTMMSYIKFETHSQQVIINVTQASYLISVSFNLYLPSQTQVILVPPNEPIENVKKILQVESTELKSVGTAESQKNTFIKGQIFGLVESSMVQLKNLKAESSKCVTLADRITGKSNKLTAYVSAFANHYGGHIYYGVSPEGIVEGQVVTEKEKQEITKKTAKVINKMIWPLHCDKPQKGKQWDISFEPVKDASGNPISSSFVIVIYVAPCPGGVFTDDPESYHILEGQVKKIPFCDWLAKMTETLTSSQSSFARRYIRRVDWSSKRRRKIFLELTTRLIHFRNNGKNDVFSTLSELAMQRFPESETKLIVKAEEIVMAYKQHCYKKAESLLRDFSECLTSVKDSSILEVRSLQLRSMIERGKGNYQESNKIAEDGLQIMQFIAPGFTTVWFYIHAAMAATTLSNNEVDSQKCLELKKKARQYLDLAARDANLLDDFSEEVSDIQQKLSTYKAFVLLGCSVTGESARQRYDTTGDIDAAAKELAFVHEIALTGKPLTHYRKVQYHLAQCDLLSLRKEGLGENSTRNVKRAFDHVTKAVTLARKYNFQDVIHYANKRRADLTEDLVRNAMTPQSKKTALPTSFSFLYLT